MYRFVFNMFNKNTNDPEYVHVCGRDDLVNKMSLKRPTVCLMGD